MNKITPAGTQRPQCPSQGTQWALFPLFLAVGLAAAAPPPIPEHPLITTKAAIPLSMIVMGRDHTLFYEAYNDASDIDGDGTLDTRFKPGITYYGLFDSGLCYSHNDKSDNTGQFTPAALAGVKGVCTNDGSPWSGNWLNYITTSRIDALRKVLYGGYREVDSTTQTILRRAYIPQDGHSWAKEYTSVAVDGYDIQDYTPLALPTPAGRRHFFGNVTMNGGTNCATLNTCSDLPPLLSVVSNSPNRVWQWASTEKLVLRNDTHGGTRTDYSVRVEVCTSQYHNGCKQYPKGSYKPTGVLHDYGENNSMLFGLLSGSYDKNMSGGVLRKVLSTFTDEVNSETGVFTTNAPIVRSIDRLRIRDFNNGRTDGHYRKGSFRTGIMAERDYVDWGNPIGEMMYETLRYLAGKGTATTAFVSTTRAHDAAVGLSAATWDDPYADTGAAKAEWCAKPNMLVVSSTNISYDSDQLPGSAFAPFTDTLGTLNVKSLGDTITAGETDVPGLKFIGAVGTNEDYAPTAKNVGSLGNIRGLAPEEPTKQGSYYSASVAFYGKTTDLNAAKGTQSTDTYAVALASPLPKFAFKVGGKTISLVPFAKTIDGPDGADNVARRDIAYQPTDPIVDFYIEEYSANHVRFRINFEADEQGNDFDMDVVVLYDMQVAGDQLTVSVTPLYQSTGSNQNLGYVISGSDRDGTYLVVQDKTEALDYFLNVPPGRSAGYCNTTPFPAGCAQLPTIANPPTPSVQVFKAGTAAAASTLRDPLWYAAKWGGFVDLGTKDGKPLTKTEWDADGNDVPDTYFFVQNPLKLRESLKRSFDTIIERSASAGNITSNGQQIGGGSRVFQTQFNSATWDGELFAYAVTTSGVSTDPSWKASTKVPSEASRKIYTWKDSTTKGIPFSWANLTAAQQTTLGAETVLKYLRGDQSKEIQNSGTYRNRNKLLGDFVHSSPYYVKDTDTVYVGGNDGMLHAFSASTGVELFAYIPGLVFDKLATLAAPTYTHTYYVDGDIAVSSLAQTTGKNYLVASTGRGAKGLFALDVTAPGSFGASQVLWEYSGATDADLGYVLGRPQIATLEDDSLAVILGNGHNSVNGKAVLYVLNLTTGALIKKLDTLVAGDNGLATPALWDSDGNGKIDTVYAGDLKGNVWRFKLSGADSSAWGSAFVSGSNPQPLFTAVDSTNKVQPITAQLTVAKNTSKSDPNYGKTFVFFGTGSYVYAADPTDKQVQTWYSLIDENSVIATRNDLMQRTFKSSGTIADHSVRVVSAATAGEMAGKKGWFIDLGDLSGDTLSATGERIVTRSSLYQFLEPVLVASSIVPDPDPCKAGGRGYVNLVDPFTGARLSYPPLDLNNDGKFDANDQLEGENVGSYDLNIGMLGEPTVVGPFMVVGGSSGERGFVRINLGGKKLGRLSWREIIED